MIVDGSLYVHCWIHRLIGEIILVVRVVTGATSHVRNKVPQTSRCVFWRTTRSATLLLSYGPLGPRQNFKFHNTTDPIFQKRISGIHFVLVLIPLHNLD